MRRSLQLPVMFLLGTFAAGRASSTIQAGPIFPTQVYLTGKGSVHHAVADLDGDDKRDLIVLNRLSNDVTVLLGQGDGTFLRGSQPSVGLSPAWVTAVDLDQDGDVDLAVANSGSADISILLGREDGSFAPEMRTAVGSGPVAVLAADLNMDGKQDLLTVNKASDNMTVLLGRGDGAFDEVPGPSVSDAPVGAVMADLNQDGWVDFAVAATSPNSVRAYMGNGAGSFTLAATYTLADPPLALRAADLTRDGRIDLLAGTYKSFGQDPYKMTVLRAISGGQFQTLPPVPIGGGLNGLAIGDVDGNGSMDVVKESYTSRSRILVFSGNGDGTFKLPRYLEGALFTSSAGLDDFDGDAILDLIEVDSGSLRNQDFGRAAVLSGHGDGTFATLAIYEAGDYSNFYLASGDFNADKTPDVALANSGCCYGTPYSGTATIFLGHGDGTLGPGTDYPVFAAGSIMTEDFNTDGHVDLGVSAGKDIALLMGLGDGSFTRSGQLTSPGNTKGGAAADFNGDGAIDVAIAESYPEEVSVFLGRGDGRFSQPISTPLGGAPFSLASGDFNADGSLDLAVQQRTNPGAVDILLGRGDGTFDPGEHLPTPQFSSDVMAGDFDEDGRVDLAVAWSDPNFNQSPGHIAIYRGRGDGTFLSPAMNDIGSVPGSVASADLNGDGHLDLATGNESSHDVSIMLGRGDGTFLPEMRVATGGTATPRDLTFADLNRDRRPDLIVSLYDLGAAVVLNTGPFSDTDHDGIVDSEDECTDSDDDGFSDPGVVRMTCAVDNCPAAFNPGQADSNDDGAGDACQPNATIEEVRQDGGIVLEVRASVADPQGEPVRGTIGFFDAGISVFQLRDPGNISLYDCSSGRSPDGIGSGLAFAYRSAGEPFLFELDPFFYCEDGRADFELAPGPCGTPVGSKFSTDPLPLMGLGQTVTSAVCLRRVDAPTTTWNWDMTSITPESLTVDQTLGSAVLVIPYTRRLPSEAPLTGLVSGRSYRMRVSAIDADTPPVFAQATFGYQGEPRIAFRDAEPPVARIDAPPDMECSGMGKASVMLDGSSSTGSGGSVIVEYTWVEDPDGTTETILASGPVATVDLSLGAHRIALRIRDADGGEGSAESTITVRDTVPPSLDCPAPATIECMGDSGSEVTLTAAATDACSGAVDVVNSRSTGGADASGRFPRGSTNVVFEAIDQSGNNASCSTLVTIQDTQAPILALSPSPAALWPPNHEMVPVHIEWQVNDLCDRSPVVTLISVSSSDADDALGMGDGNTVNDVNGADFESPDNEVQLRAERNGSGAGRTYEVTYRAADASGNVTQAFAVVTVPHDLGSGPEPLLIRLEPDGESGGLRMHWSPVAGAINYDVIRGSLSQVRVVDRKLALGAVSVLSRGTTNTAYTEGVPGFIPPVGTSFFYLIQARNDIGGTGYGTESAPWPRVPVSCEDGCP